MDRRSKRIILIVSYFFMLYWVLTNIEKVASWLSVVFGILSPVIIGVFVAFILNILLRFIEIKIIGKFFHRVKGLYKRRRLISVILTYLTTIAVIVAIIFFIVPQVTQSGQNLINTLPRYAESSQQFFYGLLQDYGLASRDINEIFGSWGDIVKSIGEFTANAVDKLFSVTLNVASGVINFFIGVVFSVYILLYKEKLKNIVHKLTRAFISEKTTLRLTAIVEEVNLTFRKFIGAQLTEALILGSMCFLGMVVLRLPYAPLISVLIGITSLIPLLGAFIGTIPSAFILFMESPIQALIFVLFIIVIQQIEGNFIYPRVAGNAIGLDGFWVFLAIIIGGNSFGILGMLISVPSMAVIYTLVRQATNKRLDAKDG